MSEAMHTPEPWRVGTVKEYLIFAGENRVGTYAIARLFDDDGTAEGYPDIANARRIVACVNACQGTPTAELELLPPGSFAKLVAGNSALRAELDAAHQRHDDVCHQTAELAASHGRLLAALVTIRNRRDHEATNGPMGYSQCFDDWAANLASAAIAATPKPATPGPEAR